MCHSVQDHGCGAMCIAFGSIPMVQNQGRAQELHNVVYQGNISSPCHLQDVNVNDLISYWLTEYQKLSNTLKMRSLNASCSSTTLGTNWLNQIFIRCTVISWNIIFSLLIAWEFVLSFIFLDIWSILCSFFMTFLNGHTIWSVCTFHTLECMSTSIFSLQYLC